MLLRSRHSRAAAVSRHSVWAQGSPALPMWVHVTARRAASTLPAHSRRAVVSRVLSWRSRTLSRRCYTLPSLPVLSRARKAPRRSALVLQGARCSRRCMLLHSFGTPRALLYFRRSPGAPARCFLSRCFPARSLSLCCFRFSPVLRARKAPGAPRVGVCRCKARCFRSPGAFPRGRKASGASILPALSAAVLPALPVLSWRVCSVLQGARSLIVPRSLGALLPCSPRAPGALPRRCYTLPALRARKVPRHSLSAWAQGLRCSLLLHTWVIPRRCCYCSPRAAVSRFSHTRARRTLALLFVLFMTPFRWITCT